SRIDFEVAVETEIADHRNAKLRIFFGNGLEAGEIHDTAASKVGRPQPPGTRRGMTPATWQRLLKRIPKGFRNKAQGCEGRATLGRGGWRLTTPTGLWPRCAAVVLGRNPFRVVTDPTHDPRAARPSQPWALLRNPF